MPITADSMLSWCQTLLDVDGRRPERTLQEYLATIPRLPSLAALPSGTPVLIRGDVDAKLHGRRTEQGRQKLHRLACRFKLGGILREVFPVFFLKSEAPLAPFALSLGHLGRVFATFEPPKAALASF